MCVLMLYCTHKEGVMTNKKPSRIYIRINEEKDADIVNRLSKQGNRSGYIKQLIRDDIARRAQ